MTEILKSPELLDNSDPLTAEGQVSWDVAIACRNLINWNFVKKTRVKVPAKMLEV